MVKEKIKIDPSKLPRHVVVIPDGNRRWARKRGLLPWFGHKEGAKKLQEICQAALELNIYCLTFWVGSWENLTKRSKPEVDFLFRLYHQYFEKLIKRKEIHQHQVRINVLGRWREILPKKTIKVIEEAIKLTKKYQKHFLNVMVAYNGTDEILAMVKSIVKEARKNPRLRITPELIKSHLWTKDSPPVDFLIRTGSRNDPHNSTGFMMWDCANSQLYFTREFFPDFGYNEFIKAIKEYQRRERRLGK